MNNEPSGQTISSSDFRSAGWTTAQRPAFGEQFRAGSAMNCAIDSSATEKCGVRRVHNGIDFELSDIAADNLNFAASILHGSLFTMTKLECRKKPECSNDVISSRSFSSFEFCYSSFR